MFASTKNSFQYTSCSSLDELKALKQKEPEGEETEVELALA